MGRRKSGIQEFIEGFNGVYNSSRKVIRDVKSAKIAGAEVEEIEGEDGATSYKYLGKDYTEAPTEAQQNYAKSQGMADVMSKFGDPTEAMRYKLLSSAQKKNDDDDAYKAAEKEWFAGSALGQANSQYAESMSEWDKSNKAHQDQMGQGASPQSLGLPPAKPERTQFDTLDYMQQGLSHAAFQAEHGRLDMAGMTKYAQAIQELQDSGVADGLNAMHAGDQDGAFAALSKAGKIKVGPESVVGFGPATANVDGMSIPTYEMKIKKSDGSIMTINAAQKLQSVGKINDTYNRIISSRGDARAGAAAGRSATTFAQGQSDRDTKKSEDQERLAAGLALYQEQNPNATKAQLDAVKAGITKPVSDKEPIYKPINSDIRAALSDKAVDSDGKPKGDLMTGREIENRNLKEERALSNFMVDNHITDANKGLIEYRKHKRAQEKKNAPLIEEERAQSALAAGVPLEEINKNRAERGLPPIKESKEKPHPVAAATAPIPASTAPTVPQPVSDRAPGFYQRKGGKSIDDIKKDIGKVGAGVREFWENRPRSP